MKYSLATLNSEYFVVKIFWLVRKLNARKYMCNNAVQGRLSEKHEKLLHEIFAIYDINPLLLQLSSNTILGELPISADMNAFPDSFLADDRSIK